MGNDLQKGTIYSEGGVGGAGTVNASNLNAHVDEARIKSTFISSKSLRDPATLSDSIVVEAGGILYRETFQQIIDLIGETIKIPIGAIIDFAGSSPPGGWLMCFGQSLSRTTYAELFDVIGVTYGGAGEGSTVFSLPDLRGRVAAGKDDMGGSAASRLTSACGIIGTTLGAEGGHQLLQAHTHTYVAIQNVGGGTSNGGGIMPFTTMTTGSTGGGDGQNVQPTVIVNKIIRYQ